MKRMRDFLHAIVSVLRALLDSKRERPPESDRGGEQRDAAEDGGADSSASGEMVPEQNTPSEQLTNDEEAEKAEESGADQSHKGAPPLQQGDESDASSLHAGEIGWQDDPGAGSDAPQPSDAEQPLDGAPRGEDPVGSVGRSQAAAASGNAEAEGHPPSGNVASTSTQRFAGGATEGHGESQKPQPHPAERLSAAGDDMRPCPRCGVTCPPDEVEEVFGYQTMKRTAAGSESVAVHRQSHCRACRAGHAAEMRNRKEPSEGPKESDDSSAGAGAEFEDLGTNKESDSHLQSRDGVASERQKEGQAADLSRSSPVVPHGEAAGRFDAGHPGAAAAPDLGNETGAVGQEVDTDSDEPSLSPPAAPPDSSDRSDQMVSGAGEASDIGSSEKRRNGADTGGTEESPTDDGNIEGAGDAQGSTANIGADEESSPSVPPVRSPARRRRAPQYRAPGGGRPAAPPSPLRRSEPNADRDTVLRSRAATIEVRVLFQRGGYCSVTLLPKRPPDLPEELLVEGGAGNVELLALEDDWYQDIVPDNLGDVLREGLVLAELGTGQEWVLSGREIFVLASGATHRGFVSCPRLGLGRDHVVLCATRRLPEVEEALREAGCASWTRLAEDDGVPKGWTAIRGVAPTKAVSLCGDEDILNILRPLPDVEIALEGGIRLAYNSWLHGYPPSIRVYGDPEHTEVVLIDGQEAVRSENQGYTSAGWAELGEHQVWCSNTSASYSIVASDTDWRFWPAYSFAPGGNPARGFSFCGPLVRPVNRARNPDSNAGDAQPIQVPPSNPVLIGARPGEVFIADRRRDVRGACCLCLPPFDPVWALPAQPLHCDNHVSRVLLIGNATGVRELSGHRRSMRRGGEKERWFRLILDASRKGLAVQPRDASTDQLWQSYKRAARNLRRRLR